MCWLACVLQFLHQVCVKFTDVVGITEGALDQGGPCREFLQLLVDFLSQNSPLFTGLEHAKHISAVNQGTLC